MDKLIITAAVTGSFDSKDKQVNLPVTPQEIVQAAIECYKEGASIAHIHVRDPKTRKPSMEISYYREVFEAIRVKCDMILNLTTGTGARICFTPEDKEKAGDSLYTTPERRTQHVAELKPEMCSLDIGTINFQNWIMANPLPDVERMAEIVIKAGTKPELEVFDIGHIDIARHLIKKGLIKENPHFQLCMGITGGISGTPENLLHMKESLPAGTTWSVLGVGATQFSMITFGIILGGHIRVGFEDNLYISKGVLAKNNAELVRKAVVISRHLDREIATPKEARQILGLYRDEVTTTSNQVNKESGEIFRKKF
jgi:uncharacterized protein (DUF849 family)